MMQTWTSGDAQSKNKLKRGGKDSKGGTSYSEDSPARFTRKKHTPATMPRTKYSSGTYADAAQHCAIDRLKQHLTFSGDEVYTLLHNTVVPLTCRMYIFCALYKYP